MKITAKNISKCKIFLSILTFFVTLSLITGISLKAAESGNTAPNQYVSNMRITTFTSKDDCIPGFEFKPDQTIYNLDISDANNMSNLCIDFSSVPGGNPYCKVEYSDNGTTKLQIGSEKSISAGTQYKQPLITLFSKVKLGQAPLDVTITIGDKDTSYADADIYTLHLSKKPGLKSLAVKDTDGDQYEISPAFANAMTVAYENKYSLTVLPGTEKISLLAAPQTAETDFYINDTKYDNPANGVEIDLTYYTANDTGVKEISFSLKYNSETYPAESSYTLCISEKNLKPVIIQQPQEISCDQDDNVTLSITANPPEDHADAELQYQWLRVRSLNAGLYDEIDGDANGSTFSPPTDIPGSEQYVCRITHTVDGEQYYVISDPVWVRVELTHIVEPELTILAGGDVTTTMGASPAAVTFAYQTKTDGSSNRTVTIRNFKVYITDNPNAEGRLIKDTPRFFAEGNRNRSFSLGTQYTPGTYYYYFTVEFYAYDRYGNSIDEVAPVTVKSDIITHTFTNYDGIVNGLEGTGTPDDPFLIRSFEDLVYIRDELIHKGTNMWGVSFRLTTDIELPADWVPMGTYKDPSILTSTGVPDGKMGANIYAFMATLDGDNHTITVADGGLPLFRFVADAVVKDLNIEGKNIVSAGLVTDSLINYGPDGDYSTGCPDMITLDNVTLRSGSRTRGSGFLTGSGSGENTIRIQNCTVEKNVIIGDGTGSNIGSFVGLLNGEVTNCVSYATVRGISSIGGIAGKKGQSMGGCRIRNCAFYGTVEASGNSVGGILGAGYEASDAPNTPVITVQNCLVTGNVTGTARVGGIVGSEGGVLQALNDGAVTDNVFVGTVTATDADGLKGGIMGYCNSLNGYQVVANNYYLDTCGAAKGIGSVKYIYTSCSTHETASDAEYLSGFNNRTDDPLGADADKLTRAMSAEAMRDGTVVKLLNDSETSLHNWMQGETSPIFFDAPVVLQLEVSGELSRQHYIGDALDLSGLTLTAIWSDGQSENITLDDPELKITGYDPDTRGTQVVALTYNGARAEIKVTVLIKPVEAPDGTRFDTIRVSLKVMGDKKHGTPTGDRDTHTLQKGGLTTWIANKTYTVDLNATVWDVLKAALQENGLSWRNPSGNYVEAITKDGVELGEFDNGNLSGWMYSLNGKHTGLGISEQFLEDGDSIIFHYTDDFTLEEGSEALLGGGGAGATVGTGSNAGSIILQPGTTVNDKGQNQASVSNKEIESAISSAKDNDAKTIVIQPNVKSDKPAISVELTLDGAKAIVKADMGLTVDTRKGGLVINDAALQSIADQAMGKDLRFNLEALDKTAEKVKTDAVKALEQTAASLQGGVESLLASASVTEVTITSDGKEITTFGGNKLTVRLPVEKEETFTEGSSYKVVVVSANGEVETLTGKCIKYNAHMMVQVEVSHLSTFIVLNEKYGAANVDLPFGDVAASEWFYEAVKYVYEAGLMQGASADRFEPQGTLNRAMLVTILHRLEKTPDAGANTFSDVAAGQWYTDAVAWASENGIVNGYGNGTFAPMNNVTREEMAAMLMRYAEYKSYDVNANKDLSGYADAAKVSTWAERNMQWANASGLIQGDNRNNLDPQGKATRAEAATILMRFCENIGK